METYYQFVELGDDGNPVTVTVTEVEAIAWQRRAGLQQDFIYPTDEQALDDWIQCHWATKILAALQ